MELSFYGNLGRDPELRYSQTGTPVLRFPVAYTDKQERTTWVSVTVFGDKAEDLAQSLRKGQRVQVRGRPEARAWLAQDGTARGELSCVAWDVVVQQRRPAQAEPADEIEPDELPF